MNIDKSALLLTAISLGSREILAVAPNENHATTNNPEPISVQLTYNPSFDYRLNTPEPSKYIPTKQSKPWVKPWKRK